MNKIVKKAAKNIFRAAGLNVTRRSRRNERVIHLRVPGKQKGKVLLSYILAPFLLKGESPPLSHTNYWESLQMAKTFLGLGYSVDAIDYTNTSFMPSREYSFFIDVRHNMERLAPLLGEECTKIMHVDLCHMLFNNAAECRRLLELQQRRGITLSPKRFEKPNLAIEYADCATVLGNDFTLGTFQYAEKPLYPIPLSHQMVFDWPEGKDFNTCRRNFIWFGSGGLVRKGLDLVLEAFASMPEFTLYICGPVSAEKDFEAAFATELYETPNIRTVGWTDISSGEFGEITKNCIGLIYPSCSEGQAGSVITCLHAGIIPVISFESGVDVHDFGILLRDCSIDGIKTAVRKVSELPGVELGSMSRKAWKYARANHTRDVFAREYKKTIIRLVESKEKSGS